jgi:hypothetical protein
MALSARYTWTSASCAAAIPATKRAINKKSAVFFIFFLLLIFRRELRLTADNAALVTALSAVIFPNC